MPIRLTKAMRFMLLMWLIFLCLLLPYADASIVGPITLTVGEDRLRAAPGDTLKYRCTGDDYDLIWWYRSDSLPFDDSAELIAVTSDCELLDKAYTVGLYYIAAKASNASGYSEFSEPLPVEVSDSLPVSPSRVVLCGETQP